MSTFAAFNSLFGQPSDPTTHPEFACKYESGMRVSESQLLDCSIRYGGVPVDEGGAWLEPFDTTIARDTVARPPRSEDLAAGGKRSLRRMGSRMIADCVSPAVSCLDGVSFDEDEHQRQQQRLENGEDVDNVILGQRSSQDSAGGGAGGGGPAVASRGSNENAQKEGNNAATSGGEHVEGQHELQQHNKPPRPASATGSIGSKSTAATATSASVNSVHTKPDDDTIHIHAIRVTSPHYEPPLSHYGNGTCSAEGTASPPPLVLLHGYANGALYFYRNLHGLSRHFPAVYTVDMLGWGLSSRPTFATKDDTVESAEDFFVEGLEAWRATNGIETMILGGHSLGGYVAIAYTERYPDRVAKLLLLSPVGIQEGLDPTLATSNSSAVQKMAYGVAKSFFDNGWTPGAVIRSVSEWKGRMGVERYVDNRLPLFKCPQERTALIGYLYNNAVLPPSGEGCLNRLLRPGAYAIHPCCHRIPKLQVGEVVFIYGEKDWMDPSAGLDVERYCRQRRAEGDLTVPSVTVHAVRNAGHLLMIENWEGFNAAVVMSCGGTLDADMAMHRPASFADKRRTNQSLGQESKMVSAAESEVTEESCYSRESVEIDVTGRYIIEEEEDFVEYGKEATWTESCTGVSLRKPL